MSTWIGRLLELLVLVDRHRVEDPLALDQRQQPLLDVDAGDVGLAADDGGDLVDLVDADGRALHVVADLLGGRVLAEDLPRALLEADEQAVRDRRSPLRWRTGWRS